MPSKDMKQFLHEFFNPPRYGRQGEEATRKKSVRKKAKKKVGPSPIQRQLVEADDFMKYKIEEFYSCTSGNARVELAYKTIPDEATTIDRLWPTELKNKDSRIRREMSNKGRDCFLKGDFEGALDYYNQAITYSSGKGLAHTLARRAGLLLQTADNQLALRDIVMAMKLGCLDNELLDLLLDHHGAGIPNGIILARKAETTYNRANLAPKENAWVHKFRSVLDEIEAAKRRSYAEAKETRDIQLQLLLGYIKQVEQEIAYLKNVETISRPTPTISQTNPLFPVFSSKLSVKRNEDKGRHAVTNDEIPPGELLAVEDSLVTILFPEKEDNILNHCLFCSTFTKAPIPCENCCCVVFCCLRCREVACNSFHQYECEMRLYEVIPLEPMQMAHYFLALRACTQRSLDYFIQQFVDMEPFINQGEPNWTETFSCKYSSSDYATTLNLVSHMYTMPEDMTMQNAIVSVYLLRCLQAGKFFQRHVPTKKKGDFSLHAHERMMLRLLHQLVCVLSYNSQPVRKLVTPPGKGHSWQRMGLALNNSVALLNHSCDPNAVFFHCDESIVVVATRHIRADEEICIGYVDNFLSLELSQRDYRLLKHYVFQCECAACNEKWPLKDHIPDSLARIPNFEQERCYVVRHGDKKDICDEINSARWMADFGITSNSFEVAQEALDVLSRSLERNIRKPHLFFVEVTDMTEKLVVNRYLGINIDELADMDKQIRSEESQMTAKLNENGSSCSLNDRNGVPARDGSGGFRQRSSTLDCDKDRMEKIESMLNGGGSCETDQSPAASGASRLIEVFERPKSDSVESSATSSARSKSPTLRIYAGNGSQPPDSADEQGQQPRSNSNRRSVLERFEESKLNKFNRKMEEVKSDVNKAKRDLVESMRRFPSKMEMAERMAAFQKKNQKNEKASDGPKSKTSEKKGENQSGASDTTNGSMPSAGGPPQKPLTQANGATSPKRQRPGQRDLHTMSEEFRAFKEKDEAVQKSISSREDKLVLLKEKNLKKEAELSQKERELMELKERTRRMMEKAKRSEQEFADSQKLVQTSLNPDRKSMLDKILAKANEKAAQMKLERQAARRKRNDEDDGLLTFLRSTHKKGGNIYSFIDEEVEPGDNGGHGTEENGASTSLDLLAPPMEMPLQPSAQSQSEARGDFKEPMPSNSMTKSDKSRGNTSMHFVPNPPKLQLNEGLASNQVDGSQIKSLGSSMSAPTFQRNGYSHKELTYNAIEPPSSSSIKKVFDLHSLNDSKSSLLYSNEASTEDVSKKNGSLHSINNFLPHFAKSWDKTVEESIRNIEASRALRPSESWTQGSDLSLNRDFLRTDDQPIHYKERWSKSPSVEAGGSSTRSSMSPERGRLSSASSPKLRPLNKPPIIVNGKMRTGRKESGGQSDQRNAKIIKNKQLPYGALNRRKSLSDNCLFAKGSNSMRKEPSVEKELDAFGIPRLPRQRRSVSLMREVFANKKQTEVTSQKSSTDTRQKAISYETRTISAAEFKNLFENGCPVNSNRPSRATTPFRPPQVDPDQMNKIKNKFVEVKPDQMKLPFPNYKAARPPIPRARPPPPPR